MIYTITLNPSLDLSGEVSGLVLDEKNYVHEEVVTAGGNGVNAGIIAHRLGSYVMLSGFLGGSNGQRLENLLTQKNVPHHFIPIAGETRMNLTISNKVDHRQTRLSFSGPRILASEKKMLLKFLERVVPGDLVLIGGSLPPGVSGSYVKSLITRVHHRKAQCLVDMPGESLKSLIQLRPDFIKPNLSEFQTLVGRKVKTIKTVLPEAQKLLRHVPSLCISSVEGGALLINKKEAWFGRLPKIKIYSSVGAGDSMVGAMASLLSEKPDASGEELLRLGLAASCASLTERGLTLGSRKSILSYESEIDLRRIL